MTTPTEKIVARYLSRRNLNYQAYKEKLSSYEQMVAADQEVMSEALKDLQALGIDGDMAIYTLIFEHDFDKGKVVMSV